MLNIYRLISQWSLGWETEGGKFGQLCKRGWEDEKHFLENQIPQDQCVSGAASQLLGILGLLLPDSTTLPGTGQTFFWGLCRQNFWAVYSAEKSECYPCVFIWPLSNQPQLCGGRCGSGTSKALKTDQSLDLEHKGLNTIFQLLYEGGDCPVLLILTSSSSINSWGQQLYPLLPHLGSRTESMNMWICSLFIKSVFIFLSYNLDWETQVGSEKYIYS